MTHEIIHTADYLLVVSDEEIKEGGYDFSINYKTITHVDKGRAEMHKTPAYKGLYKKIIAHLLLHNAPFLEGVDLLPPLEQEDDVEKLGNKFSNGFALNLSHQLVVALNEGFKEGYNKAREKYKYTKEDMMYMFEMGYRKNVLRETTFEDAIGLIDKENRTTLPIAFECEMEYKFPSGREYVQPNPDCLPKTTTNSKGQTQWVGKYIYA